MVEKVEAGCVWVEPLAEDVVGGEVGEMARVNGVRGERRWGYWYGERDEQGGEYESESEHEQ